MMLHHQAILLDNDHFYMGQICPVKTIKLLLVNDPRNQINKKGLELVQNLKKYEFFAIQEDSVKELQEIYADTNAAKFVTPVAVVSPPKKKHLSPLRAGLGGLINRQGTTNISYAIDEENDEYNTESLSGASEDEFWNGLDSKNIKDVFEQFFLEDQIPVIGKGSTVYRVLAKDARQITILFTF